MQPRGINTWHRYFSKNRMRLSCKLFKESEGISYTSPTLTHQIECTSHSLVCKLRFTPSLLPVYLYALLMTLRLRFLRYTHASSSSFFLFFPLRINTYSFGRLCYGLKITRATRGRLWPTWRSNYDVRCTTHTCSPAPGI